MSSVEETHDSRQKWYEFIISLQNMHNFIKFVEICTGISVTVVRSLF